MDKKQLLEDFAQRVLYVHEFEYGDFKRKIGLYLNRLEQELQLKSAAGHAYFSHLRELVIYNPNGNIDTTRSRIVEETRKLQTLI